ncbi:hypothetical protein ES703_79253 [subsurface metagenome]
MSMTLDKAIEILSEHVKISKLDYLPDVRVATLLLIEAGKRIISGRDTPSGLSFIPLPGETEVDTNDH